MIIEMFVANFTVLVYNLQKKNVQGMVKILTIGFILVSGESGGQAFLH